MFQITKFTLSDRIYPFECTYMRIEDLLRPRQILRAVKVRAIWLGKEPCSFCFSGTEILQNFSYFLFKLSQKVVKLENCLSHVLTRVSHERGTMRQVGHPCNVFTEHVPVYMQDRNMKGDHFHLEGKGAPQLLGEFINMYLWYFLNFRGFKFKMSLPSQSSPSRNYTSPFSGVVLLLLFVAGLQNSRLNRAECTFSTIFTCVHLPGGVSVLSVYLRIYRCTAGTSPDCC